MKHFISRPRREIKMTRVQNVYLLWSEMSGRMKCLQHSANCRQRHNFISFLVQITKRMLDLHGCTQVSCYALIRSEPTFFLRFVHFCSLSIFSIIITFLCLWPSEISNCRCGRPHIFFQLWIRTAFVCGTILICRENVKKYLRARKKPAHFYANLIEMECLRLTRT